MAMTHRDNTYGTCTASTCVDFVSLLTRNTNNELGLVISGAKNLDGSTGLIISDILDETTSTKPLRIGDQILAVNGVSLRNKPYRYAVQTLREAGKVLELSIHRCNAAPVEINCTQGQPFSGRMFEGHHQLQKQQSNVELYRSGYEFRQLAVNPSQSCSNLQTSEDRTHADLTTVHLDKRENDESLGVELVSRIFVNSVNEGGLADKSGLRSGDRLISLNGINTAHLSLVDTANILRRQETLLEVAREKPSRNPSGSIAAGSNISRTAYSTQQPENTTNRRYFSSPRKRRPFTEHTAIPNTRLEDIRFSSLHDLHSRNRPLCRKCSRTQSLQDVFHSKTLPHSDSECQMRCHRAARQRRKAERKHSHHHCQDRVPEKDRSWTLSPITVDQLTDSFSSSETMAAKEEQPELHRIRAQTSPLPSQSAMRQVLFRVDPQSGTGLALVGGNKTGVFVSAVQPDSMADQAGIGEGDQIKAINGLGLDGWTKEEVALALISDDGPMVLSLLHEPLTYSEVRQSNQPTDSFSVRAYFNLKPNSYALKNNSGLPELAVKEGDIFQVVDSFPGGVFGNWQAYKTHPSVTIVGIIPNMQRAEGLLAAETAKSSVRVPAPYEKVILVDNYPLPRPVVIYGPLSSLARQQLQNMTDSMSVEENIGTTRFEVPPINAQLNQTGPECSSAGLVRLSAIQTIMGNGAHCLLDINMNAIQRLNLLGVPPIVILISPSSRKQLQMVLQHYWELDRHSIALQHPDLAVRRKSDISLLADRLWNEVLALKQYRAHLISDSVPVNTENSRGLYFSEVDWIRNLISVIQHQQSGPVWIGEDTQMTEEILQLCANDLTDEAEEFQEKKMQSPTFTAQSTTKLNNQSSPRIIKETKYQQSPKSPSPRAEIQDSRVSAHQVIAKSTQTSERQIPINYESKGYDESLLPVPVLPNFGQKSLVRARQIHAGTYNGLVERFGNGTQRWLNGLSNDSFESDITTEWETSRSHLAEEMRTSLPMWVPSISARSPQPGTSNFELEKFGIVIHSPSIHLDKEQAYYRAGKLLETTIQSDNSPSLTPRGDEDQKTTNADGTARKVQSPDGLHLSPADTSSRPESHSNLSSLPLNTTENILAECAGEFGYEGGALELPEYQVRLYIPRAALPVNCEKQRIFMRIYDSHPDCNPGSTKANGNCSPRLISPVVMCGPHGLHFRTPVELTVPRYHFDSDSEEGNADWKITLLHTSANSTSTDEESLKREVSSRQSSANWHEIPLIHNLTIDENKVSDKNSNNSNVLGITSLVQHSKIAILIDHF